MQLTCSFKLISGPQWWERWTFPSFKDSIWLSNFKDTGFVYPSNQNIGYFQNTYSK